MENEDLGTNTATAVATKPETETETETVTGMADAEAKQKSIWDTLMRQKNRNWDITRAKCPLTWPPYSKLKDVVLDKNFHKDLCMRSDLSARKRVLTPNGKKFLFTLTFPTPLNADCHMRTLIRCHCSMLFRLDKKCTPIHWPLQTRQSVLVRASRSSTPRSACYLDVTIRRLRHRTSCQRSQTPVRRFFEHAGKLCCSGHSGSTDARLKVCVCVCVCVCARARE